MISTESVFKIKLIIRKIVDSYRRRPTWISVTIQISSAVDRDLSPRLLLSITYRVGFCVDLNLWPVIKAAWFRCNVNIFWISDPQIAYGYKSHRDNESRLAQSSNDLFSEWLFSSGVRVVDSYLVGEVKSLAK